MRKDHKAGIRFSRKESLLIVGVACLLVITTIIILMINIELAYVFLIALILGGYLWNHRFHKKNDTDVQSNSQDDKQQPVQNFASNTHPNLYVLQYQQLFSNYQDLQNTSLQHLSKSAQNKLKNIEEIMHLMNDKLQNSQNQSFQHEIMDIQKTLNAYLSPALQHFIDLPQFLRDRQVLDHQQTPNQIIEQQLQMIVDEFQNIAESIYTNDLNQLIDHGQFLKYKLKQPELFKIQQNSHKD